MSITNEDRYNLQTKANDLLGRKEGATLMELLPPVGWADVATKRDLDQLEERSTALPRPSGRRSPSRTPPSRPTCARCRACC